MPEATVDDTTSVEVLMERIKELEEELANAQPSPEDHNPKHVPAEFRDMFEALRKSGAVKGIDLPTPTIFTGEELKNDPYALHRCYKEVSCWVKARVGKDIPQAAMALQTLGGTARLAMENRESSHPGQLKSINAIFQALLDIFQRCDLGPKAYDEFLRTRMRPEETAVDFLNRLLSLSVVINSSKDPTVHRITDEELAARFRARLPGWMMQQLREKHQLLVSLHQVPDVSAWGLAGTAIEIEQNKSHDQVTTGKFKKMYVPGRTNAILDSRIQDHQPNRQQRSSKRFQDLEEQYKDAIRTLQEDLKPYELKATLPSRILKRCRELSVCESCHRYGHNSKGCKARDVFSPKN
eukprot:scaffold2864_cov422-Pavlova_lutheri.AAC.3